MKNRAEEFVQVNIPADGGHENLHDTNKIIFAQKKMFFSRKKSPVSAKSTSPNRASDDFSPITQDWMRDTTLQNKQSLGQFMSPKPLRTYLLNQLNIKHGDRVLDPAVGTGEFLHDVKSRCPGVKLYGWDIDEQVLEYAAKLVPTAQLQNISALLMPDKEQYDFVIGNPPYFQLKLTKREKTVFQEVISGRPNIFALFFKVGLEALKPNGELAYIVPPSMNAGAYFQRLREFVIGQYHVKHLKIFNQTNLFNNAQTPVQVIVVKKGIGRSAHASVVQDRSSGKKLTLLSENIRVAKEKFIKYTSLHGLGYEAITGSVVWNLNKDKLSNEKNGKTFPLLYARNIVDNKIVFLNDARRPQYIATNKLLKGKAIVVNRIIGSLGKGFLKCAFVDEDFVFAAENHLNVILPRRDVAQKISMEKLFSRLTNARFIANAISITGNTQLSANEWNYFVPLNL